MKRKKLPKKIKEKKLDAAFSLFIRFRDGKCQYPLRGSDDYHAGPLQCSHFHGRSARSTRWDLDNCDAMCARHHQFLEGRKSADYADWKLSQLGPKRFDELKKRYYKLKSWSEKEKAKLLKQFT